MFECFTGLGKTATVCYALRKLVEKDAERFGKILVVCPLAVLEFWKAEFYNVGFKGKVCIYHSDFAEESIPISECDVAISTYHGVVDADVSLFNSVVLDEAHDPLRNGKTQVFKFFTEQLATKPVRTHLLCLPLALQSASVLPALPSLVACSVLTLI